MTTTPPEPPDDDQDAIDWDNVMHVFEVMSRHTDPDNPPPPDPVVQADLPDDDAVADFMSRVTDLEYAETDADKVLALKEITRWLAQWKF